MSTSTAKRVEVVYTHPITGEAVTFDGATEAEAVAKAEAMDATVNDALNSSSLDAYVYDQAI